MSKVILCIYNISEVLLYIIYCIPNTIIVINDKIIIIQNLLEIGKLECMFLIIHIVS